MPTTPPPYESLKQIEKLKAEGNHAALEALRKSYMTYFRENQCEPLNDIEGWNDLGEYFLGLAMKGSNGLKQTREEFVAATAGMLKQPIPAWIKTVTYVQTEPEGTYYLALPPKALAEQAFLHARNPKTGANDYVLPPIYAGFTPDVTTEQVLNTRICDYVISHCG